MIALRVLVRLLVFGGVALVVLVIGAALVTGTWGLLAATVIGLVPAGIGHDLWRMEALSAGTGAGPGGAEDDPGSFGDEAALAAVTTRHDDRDDRRNHALGAVLDSGTSISGDAGGASSEASEASGATAKPSEGTGRGPIAP